MRRVIAILALLAPAITFADLCGSNTERVYTLSASTVTTVGVGLSGRKQITVCSSNANTATSVVQCRGDGTSVTLGDSNVGIQLARGQCRVFGSPASVAISCVSNESSVVVKTEECTGSIPPPAVVNGPPASTSVTGSVTANQGTAGSAAWPVTGSGTAGSPATGVVSVQGVINGAPVPTSSAYSAPITATWTSATAVDTVLQISTDGFTTVGVQIAKTGIITLGTVVFQVSNLATGPWSTISAGRTKGEQVDESFALSGISTTDPTAWQVFVSGYKYFQVKLSVAITNTGSAALSIMASQAGTKPGTGIVVGSKAPNTVLAGSNSLQVLPAVSLTASPSGLTDNYEQPLSVTSTGNLRTTAAGARAGVSGECLVLTTAGGTPCPATPLASRREVALFNNGPNPIYCAIGASVPVVGVGLPIYPLGWFSFPAGPAVPVTCIAATASQVTTAATSVIEVAQ
jgi:hypothetical protein